MNRGAQLHTPEAFHHFGVRMKALAIQSHRERVAHPHAVGRSPFALTRAAIAPYVGN